MDYEQALELFINNLPMFQKSGSSAYRKDLGNIVAICNHLGNPQNNFKSIHVAGTNGKGSTSHMLASILQESGYKTGLTTSPHLKDFRERIRINGELCTKEFVIDFVEKHQKFIEKIQPSFFEVAIAMAFEYFSQNKVDVAIIETGLGGRLDATNIIHPILSIITNIGWDHTNILGNTLVEIANEKSGIIKKKTPVIIGETSDELKNVFLDKAKTTESEIIFAEENFTQEYDSDLKGIYQKKNQKTVISAIEQLKKLGFEISENNIANGLKSVIANTGLRGRWEILGNQPLIVADTAHNSHGLSEVQKQISTTKFRHLHLVLGFVNDKDVTSILDFFPKDATYYFSQPEVPRKLEIQDLMKIVPEELDAKYFNSINEAFEAAKSKAAVDDMIYVGGSTFVVAEVI